MQSAQRIQWLAPLIILIAGFTAFVAIVRADTASTDVTVGNASPGTPTVNFNGGSAITLTEATYKYATATITVSDNNGCSTINAVEARAFLASTSPADAGNACAANDNSCYISASSTIASPTLGGCYATTTGNTCTGGSDTSVEYDCGFKFWYIAEGTDSGAPVWASSIWTVSATTSDGLATSTATNSGQLVEINTLAALDVTGTLSYSTLSPGSNTGSTNSTTTATTTGNIAIDAQISGTDMTSAPYTIANTQQKYDTAPCAYGSCTYTLDGTPTTREFASTEPTSTTTPKTQAVSWGIAIPGGQANGTYTGTNTFTAVND
ncbi:MAG TPA: hypothetical protein VJJ22_03460 [Candidatus Paceibacterota bacterium]